LIFIYREKRADYFPQILADENTRRLAQILPGCIDLRTSALY